MVGISIHALHEESDGVGYCFRRIVFTFQSTLSMRRATSKYIVLRHQIVISIHALHEESDVGRVRNKQMRAISIHALHEESDLRLRLRCRCQQISIHALHEESDACLIARSRNRAISIHALHEESDRYVRQSERRDYDFNPRSP